MRNLIISCLILSGLSSGSLVAQKPSPHTKQSYYFQYEGYTQPVYKSFDKRSLYVPLSDGVKLAVDIFLPSQGPERKDFPTVLIYTPYNRAYLVPKMGPLKSLASKLLGNGWGPIYDQSDFDFASTFLAHGYAIVVADMRGTGASFGSQMPLMPSLGKDGKELIDWIAEQTWSDGKVGMIGPSYLGWAQFLTAAHQPEALKCIIPEVIGFEMYTDGNRPGGISAKRWISGFGDRFKRYGTSDYKLKEFLIPAAPVIDEDGDGKIRDERPKNIRSVLEEQQTPRFKDHQKRTESLYLAAVSDHLDNIDLTTLLAPTYAYFDSPGPAPYEEVGYMKSSPGYHAKGIIASQVAIYHIGGWFDGFTRGTTKLYSTFAATNPSKLMIGPRVHFPNIPKAYQKFFNYKGKYDLQLILEQLRFMDYHLKGIDNGIETEAPVYYYVMQAGWREAEAWPLPNQEVQRLYFAPQQQLSPALSNSGMDTYQVDYTHQSSYGKQKRNRWIMYSLGPKTVMERSKHDEQCLVYDSETLSAPLTIAGHPEIELYLSSDQPDGDVFVYLSEVKPDGKAIYITEGQLRAGWHQPVDAAEQVDNAVEVKPELPWFGFKQDQYEEAPFAKDKVLKLHFDLMPTAWQFQPGSKIRISIAGADAENFEFNPTLLKEGEKVPSDAAHYFVKYGKGMPSGIRLPVVPD